MTVRPLTPDDDLDRFAQMVLASYVALDGHPPDAEYDQELLAVADRIRTDTVLGAFVDGRPAGCCTYVGDASSPNAELLEDDEASFRMLAVDVSAQGRGIGELLVTTCIERARAAGRRAIFISSGVWMHTAHRLYERLGFERDPARDRVFPDIGVELLGYRLVLDPHGPTAG